MRDGARLLFQVFADAYERQSVVITTNLELSRWGSVFDGEQMAAVIDRIVHHGRLVQSRRESYRVRHALMQKGQVLKKGAHGRCTPRSNPDALFAQILLTKHARFPASATRIPGQTNGGTQFVLRILEGAGDRSGSVEKVGVAPEPKRVGPASMNLEYG